eukprot:scaffold9559_cov101-Isochrysis_galbana.AAC.11
MLPATQPPNPSAISPPMPSIPAATAATVADGGAADASPVGDELPTCGDKAVRGRTLPGEE